MADVILSGPGAAANSKPGEGRAASATASHLRWDIIELLFFAYRDFVGDADQELEAFGFGRAHHRVMHFVHRYPGLKVADLLDVLRITKQSLGRVLKQLLDEDYIVQKAGNNDRRQRLLFDTAGLEAIHQFLRAMIDRDDPDKVLEAIFRASPATAKTKE